MVRAPAQGGGGARSRAVTEAAGSAPQKSRTGRRPDTSGIGSRPACGTAGRVPGRPGRRGLLARRTNAPVREMRNRSLYADRRARSLPDWRQQARCSRLFLISDAAPSFRRHFKLPTLLQASNAAQSFQRHSRHPTPLRASDAISSVRRRSRAFKAIPTHTRQTKPSCAVATGGGKPNVQRRSRHPTPLRQPGNKKKRSTPQGCFASLWNRE